LDWAEKLQRNRQANALSGSRRLTRSKAGEGSLLWLAFCRMTEETAWRRVSGACAVEESIFCQRTASRSQVTKSMGRQRIAIPRTSKTLRIGEPRVRWFGKVYVGGLLWSPGMVCQC